MADDHSIEERRAAAEAERAKYVEAVLNSTARRKIVVAGPGTGKTYLFKQILKTKRKALTLSFINSLVEDLMLDLCGMSDVRTLHSYAHQTLQDTSAKPRMFGTLSYVIAKDALILLGEKIKFEDIFHLRDDNNSRLDFYHRWRKYYGYYGYNDIVYALVKFWEAKPDRILGYDQVLVDEFQDFSKLEVSLIELLAQKSPILLAGDDDQALYGFKQASVEYIRERFHESNTTYESFVLPHCSRCTRVIVDATNDIVQAAEAAGKLPGRISKQYLYFDEKRKDQESADNPYIVYKQEFDKAIPYFIDKQIQEIAKSARDKFGVLVIAPYRKQVARIVAGLTKKGFEHVEASRKQESDETALMLDGLKLLSDDPNSNLGWRLVCESLLNDEQFSALMNSIKLDEGTRVVDLVDADTRGKVEALLKIVEKIRDEKKPSREEIDQLCEYTDFRPHDLANEKLQQRFPKQVTRKVVGRNIPVRVTTTRGSKGLAEQYVFITHCDDQYLVAADDKTDVSADDICLFLVAMTRARRRVVLISTQHEEPTFVKWIRKERIHRLKSAYER